MRGWLFIAGAAFLSSAASAQTNAVSNREAISATVDASGKVAPVAAAPVGVEVLGASASKASPCADAPALPQEAARELVRHIAAEEHFYPEFVLSVAKIESRYVSIALSEKGAYGLMQLTPATARRYEVDLCEPADNVRGGVRYLRSLHDRYRNPFFMLAAYNAGEDAVEKFKGVPPYPETVRFVSEVINDFYAWPSPSTGVAGLSATKETGPSTGEPPDSRTSGSPDDNPKFHAAEQWTGGFVRHVQ